MNNPLMRSGIGTLALLLGLLLAACGSTTTPPSASGVAAASATATPQPTPAATATPAPTAAPTATVVPAEAAQPGATAAAQAETAATIKLFMFKPAVLDVRTGTTVIWTNEDAIEHSITAGMPGQPGDAFDSGFFEQGGTFAFTFTEPGEYAYFCKRHESMLGKVNVTAP
ncbi:MAG TPA: plastocyanin/azurin family copper-binding protein [Herpetosiphonaceae bacterium]